MRLMLFRLVLNIAFFYFMSVQLQTPKQEIEKTAFNFSSTPPRGAGDVATFYFAE